MRSRRWTGAFLTVTLLLALNFVGPGKAFGAHSHTALKQTVLCGRLVANTTWTASPTPYLMQCNVTVDPGITLTIQPGVIVDTQSATAIQVRGILQAVGTADQPIVLGNTARWKGIRFVPGANPSSTISYTTVTNVSDTAVTNYPGPLLSHDTFIDDHIAVGGSDDASGTFRTLDHALTVDSADVLNDDGGIAYNLGTSNLTVSNSYFSGNGDALYVAGNYGGLRVSTSTFANNTIAIRLLVDIDNVFINQNTIYGSHSYNIQLDDKVQAKIDATNNWWGTTAVSDIQRSLLDCNVDLALPCVNFQPFLSGAPAGAPAGPVNATPTPTPPPTATSTPTPSPTPTALPTSTATASPTPTAPATFAVASVKVEYASASISRALNKPSLGRIRSGQRVKLVIYARFANVVQTTPLQTGFRITCRGRTVHLSKGDTSVEPRDNSGTSAYWEYFAPRSTGQCRFIGTVFFMHHHQHKAVDFSVR